MASINEMTAFGAGEVKEFKRRRNSNIKGYDLIAVIKVKGEKQHIEASIGEVLKTKNNLKNLPRDIIERLEKNIGRKVEYGKYNDEWCIINIAALNLNI